MKVNASVIFWSQSGDDQNDSKKTRDEDNETHDSKRLRHDVIALQKSKTSYLKTWTVIAHGLRESITNGIMIKDGRGFRGWISNQN